MFLFIHLSRSLSYCTNSIFFSRSSIHFFLAILFHSISEWLLLLLLVSSILFFSHSFTWSFAPSRCCVCVFVRAFVCVRVCSLAILVAPLVVVVAFVIILSFFVLFFFLRSKCCVRWLLLLAVFKKLFFFFSRKEREKFHKHALTRFFCCSFLPPMSIVISYDFDFARERHTQTHLCIFIFTDSLALSLSRSITGSTSDTEKY